MGVASYSEDIYHRFLESTAASAIAVIPEPPYEICPFCRQSFLTHLALVGHLSRTHRGERPILIIHGQEPEAFFQIRNRLLKARIIVSNCTRAEIKLNGRGVIGGSLQNLASLLADQIDSVVDVELQNRFDAVAEPIRQHYRLQFRIADNRALEAVDRAFVEHLGTPTPTMDKVATFLGDHRCKGLAAEYADSLATYVRAVLIKDSDKNTGVTLRPSEARDLYGNALHRLTEYPRLLPSVICALVRFAANDFSYSKHPTGVSRLDRAVAFLAPLVGRKRPELNSTFQPGGRMIALCPIDQALDRVLRLTELLADQHRWGPTILEECRQAASAETLEAADRQKILALWAANALRLNAPQDAAEPLRQLRITYPFGGWADSHLQRLEGDRQ